MASVIPRTNGYSRLQAAALRAAVGVVQRVPRRLALAWGERLGAAMYWLARRGRRRSAEQGIDRLYRKTTLRNLEMAFGSCRPRRELVGIARDCFRNTGRTCFETLRVPAMTDDDILSVVDCESLKPFEDALGRGKGAIVLVAHVGTWELLGAYITVRFGSPTYAVALRLTQVLKNQLMARVRCSHGMEVIYQEQGARPVLRALRRNRPVFILGDTYMMGIDGIFVDFFGRPAFTPTGPAALSRASGAPIVPVFIRWNGLRHRVHARPAIEPVNTGDKGADIEEMTRRWMRAVEDFIRAYPEQWLWFLRRWRGGPSPKRDKVDASKDA